jgi:3-oxo-5-alpha-steroid 4-dehydrogenase 1
MNEALFHRDLALAYLAIAAVVFVVLFFIPAAYGRHTRAGWGPLMSTRLSWIIMESTSLLVFATCMLLGSRSITPASGILGALWLGHYLHRAWIFPFRMKMSARPTPVVICAMAILFNLGNAYLNARWIYTLSPGSYSEAWLRDPRFLLGVALFLAGFAINYASDRTLATLRAPGESGYKIPQGGLYRWISCPNYFGEIIEWSGFALAAWSLPGLSFAVWTAANLAPRAIVHHRWYRTTFPEYPPARKALIPNLL